MKGIKISKLSFLCLLLAIELTADPVWKESHACATIFQDRNIVVMACLANLYSFYNLWLRPIIALNFDV